MNSDTCPDIKLVDRSEILKLADMFQNSYQKI